MRGKGKREGNEGKLRRDSHGGRKSELRARRTSDDYDDDEGEKKDKKTGRI